MKNRELKLLLQDALQTEQPSTRLAETVTLCTGYMQKYKTFTKESRIGFMQFLSSVFRFEGLLIFGLQTLTLFLIGLMIPGLADAPQFLPALIPFFVLAALPVLFKSQYYNMNELEAATRSSGAQIMLAKLILLSSANLICMAVLSFVLFCFQHSDKGLIVLVLYCFVPYLICMTFLLHFFRQHKKRRAVPCIIILLSFCIGWGIIAKSLPWLYEMSSFSIWILTCGIFAVFYIREFIFIIKTRKEGKMYGIIA